MSSYFLVLMLWGQVVNIPMVYGNLDSCTRAYEQIVGTMSKSNMSYICVPTYPK